MKRIFFIIPILFLVIGCSSKQQEKPAIKIDNIKVSASEFNEAFKSSNDLHVGKDKKKEFLNTFISRKLMLREAEKLGLDKKKAFLDDVQLFWEQSLLKSLLSIKTKELSLGVNVGEKEIKNYYEANKSDFGENGLAQVHNKIKWLLLKDKQQAAITGWIKSLRDKAEIKIDYNILGIKEKH